MTCKCGNNCDNSSSANSDALIAEMQDQLQEVLTAVNFLLKGHPELVIEDTDDIASFDFSSGKGFDTWQGWAVCDGQSHISSKKKTIQTPNYIDRFVVMAGGSYAVGDIGGADTVTLTTTEMPAHDHTLTDPGHNHAVTDTGHDHGVTDPGHAHTLTDPGHTHTIPNHSHGFTPAVFSVIDDLTGPYAVACGATSTGTNFGGITTDVVSQTIASSNTGITMADNFTGIDINPAFTGVAVQNNDTGITMAETGGDGAHENRPPYYGSVWVKYIG
jgi:microcystin-dependent protein